MYVRISVYQFLKSSQTTLKSRCEFNNLFKQMDRDRFRIERRHMIVRPPLGSLGMDTWKQRYSKHGIECDSLFLVRLNKDFSYIWGFQLDLNLRLNLSFTKFFIKDVFTHCELGKMLLYNDFPTGIEDFRLCGRRHAFTHYSSSSSFFLEIQYKDTDPVEIYYVFSVFAKNIVSNVPRMSTLETKHPTNVHDVYSYIIHLLNGTLSTFRIYAEKKLRICIKAKSEEGISYVFIDSPIITLSSSLYSKINYSVICSSTFQLLFQIFNKISEHYIGSDYNDYNLATYSDLNFTTINAHYKTIKIDDMNKGLKFNLPGPLFPNTTKSRVIHFRTTRQIQVNLTLFSVKYEGMETSDCRYGGMSIFDHKTRILDICRNYGKHTSWRDIYSTYSKLTIVIYSYFPYSNISTNILVSTTKCKPVRIHLCHFDHKDATVFNYTLCKYWLKRPAPKSNIKIKININRRKIIVEAKKDKCGIIQLSTDFIDTFCPFFVFSI